MSRALRKASVALLSTMAALLTFSAVAAIRQNAPGKSIPTGTRRPAGTIYLCQVGDPSHLWCIEGDQTSPRMLAEGVTGEPSRELHDGQRWFVAAREVSGRTCRNGRPRRELFLLREDSPALQLTDSADLEPSPFALRWPVHEHDRAISWVARRLNAEGHVTVGGIYTAQIACDSAGRPIGLSAQPTTPALAVPLVAGTWAEWTNGAPVGPSERVPDIGNHDWSPDGTSVVFESLQQQLLICRLDGDRPRLLTPRAGFDPAWSADGSVIAFKIMEPYGAIATIRPDAAQLRCVLRGQPGESTVCHPAFAPDSDRIVFTRVCRPINPAECDYASIYRVCCRDLGSEQQFDVTPNGYVHWIPLAWR